MVAVEVIEVSMMLIAVMARLNVGSYAGTVMVVVAEVILQPVAVTGLSSVSTEATFGCGCSQMLVDSAKYCVFYCL